MGTPVRVPLPSGGQVPPAPGAFRFYWLLTPAPTFLPAGPLPGREVRVGGS